MENTNFTLSEVNKNKATKDELVFIFSQAEALLKETLASADAVVNRSTILLGILLGGLTSIIGCIFSNNVKAITPMCATLVIVSLYIFFIIRKVYFNLKGSTYKITGSQPKDLFHNWYFENYKDEQRERQFIIGEIESYQKRIKHNIDINTNRWLVFDFCMKLSLFIPGVFVVVGFILNLPNLFR